MLQRLLFFFAVILAVEAENIEVTLPKNPELAKCIPTLDMYDASGKHPSGLKSGNFIDLGNFDQCLRIEDKNNKSEIVKGKYCMVKLHLLGDKESLRLLLNIFGNTFSILYVVPDSELLTLREKFIIPSNNSTELILGWCVPHTCAINELTSALSKVLQEINPRMKVTPVFDGLCQTKDDLKNEYNANNLVIITFFAFTIFLMAISTVYDIYIQYYDKRPAHLLLIAFSVKANGQKLLSVNNDPELLPCLNGIRFITIMWVVYTHRMITSFMQPTANIDAFRYWVHSPANMYIINSLAADTFLFLSGVLIVYGYCLAKNKGVKFNIIIYYLHRYLRLTPVLAVIIWFHVTIIDFFGSGPLWPFTTAFLKNSCVNYWWSSLIYIQNYYNVEEMCLGQTWYLAVDMQLFILSPLFLIPLWKWPKQTLFVSVLFVVGSMATSFSETYINDLKTSHNIPAIESLIFAQRYYVTTHTRYGPWLIGLIFGYYLFKLKINKDTTISLHPIQIVFGWIIAIGLLLSTLYGGHSLPLNPDKLGNSFFNSLHRHGWALGLCWVVYACSQGYGGPINSFLSWSLFQILSRFTYNVYLVHLSFQYLMMGYSRTSNFYSDFARMHEFWGDFIISLAISVCLSIAYELPMVTIEKELFKIGQKYKKPEFADSFGVGKLFSDL